MDRFSSLAVLSLLFARVIYAINWFNIASIFPHIALDFKQDISFLGLLSTSFLVGIGWYSSCNIRSEENCDIWDNNSLIGSTSFRSFFPISFVVHHIGYTVAWLLGGLFSFLFILPTLGIAANKVQQ